MGYNTEVAGEFKIVGRPMTIKDMLFIKSMLQDADPDYSKFDTSMGEPHYVQLQLTKDVDGIEWDGSEKFYKILESVNFIIQNIKPIGLHLQGQFECQGDEISDRYYIVIGDDGYAKQVKATPTGAKITCPHCSKEFYNEGK